MVSWLQAVLGATGAVISAMIAGSFAVRNARRTPHDSLKSLIEIGGSDSVLIDAEDLAILKEAAHQEVLRIGRLDTARAQGFWAYQRERVRLALLTERDPARRSGIAVWVVMIYLFAPFLRECWAVVTDAVGHHGWRGIRGGARVYLVMGVLGALITVWAGARVLVRVAVYLHGRSALVWGGVFYGGFWAVVVHLDPLSPTWSTMFYWLPATGVSVAFYYVLMVSAHHFRDLWRALEAMLYWSFRDVPTVRRRLRYRVVRLRRGRLLRARRRAGQQPRLEPELRLSAQAPIRRAIRRDDGGGSRAG